MLSNFGLGPGHIEYHVVRHVVLSPVETTECWLFFVSSQLIESGFVSADILGSVVQISVNSVVKAIAVLLAFVLCAAQWPVWGLSSALFWRSVLNVCLSSDVCTGKVRVSLGVDTRLPKIIFPRLPLAVQSPRSFPALRIPPLVFWLASFELPTLPWGFCCVLPGQGVRGSRGEREARRISPVLLARSFRHLLYWHCHHFCYWHCYCCPGGHHGLASGLGKERKKNKTSTTTTTTTTKENLHTPSVL